MTQNKRPIDYDGTWHKYIVEHFETGTVRRADIIDLLNGEKDIPAQAADLLIGLISGSIKEPKGIKPLSFKKLLALLDRYREIKIELAKKNQIKPTPHETAVLQVAEEFGISDRAVYSYLAEYRELLELIDRIPSDYAVTGDYLESEFKTGKLPKILKKFMNYNEKKLLK
jgi:hypothetical protein